MPDGNKERCKMSIVNNFSINATIPNIKDSIDKAKEDEIPISLNIPQYKNDTVTIDGIIGIDLIPSLKVCELVCVKGNSYFRFANGYIPVGTVKINKNMSSKEVKDINIKKRQVDAVVTPISNKYDKLNDFCTGAKNKNAKPTNKTHCLNNDPTSSTKNNKLNNTLSGRRYKVYKPSAKQVKNAERLLLNAIMNDTDHVTKTLESALISLESIGIRDEISLYDQDMIKKFKQNIEIKNNRYQVELPWDDDILKKVPSNFVIAKMLARKISERCEKEGFLNEYESIFDEQLKNNVIEPIIVDDNFDPEDFKWIPHHPVIKNDTSATTKIRAVLNCKFKTGQNPCLNDAAYDGVDLNNSMLGILQYARTNKYLITGDIEKAFHQIELKTQYDRNKFAILIYKNGEYNAYCYRRIIFGYKTSPFILNIVLHHLASSCQDIELKNILCKHFYVDNLVHTFNDINQASETIIKTTVKLNEVGFPLREFASNNDLILNKLNVPKEDNKQTVKLLGYNYIVATDQISLRNYTLNRTASTRRQVLSAIAEIFDPLGIATPLSVNAKLLMRAIVERKLKWDEKLPQDLLKQYASVCNIYDMCASKFIVDRQTVNSESPADIVCFVDASKTAYGFVAYTVQNNKTNLLFSKSKLAPMPPKSLPTLELLSSFLALKCVNNIIKEPNFTEIKINKITIFSDSQVSLAWLLKGAAPRKNVFVNNRLKDIRLLQQELATINIPVEFKFTTGCDNIADLITRATTSTQITERLSEWINGPQWILSGVRPEVNLGCIPHQYTDMVATLTTNDDPNKIDIIDITRYSSYSMLLRVVTRVFMAVNIFKKFQINKKCISATECDRIESRKSAFRYIIQQNQNKYYPDVIAYLQDRSQHNAPPIVFQLNLYLDENNIIRSKSRIDKCMLINYDAKNPVLIHPSSYLAKLLILHAHEKCNHLGTDSTLNYVRSVGFWIPRARSTIQKYVTKCISCQKYNKRPFHIPKGTVLPADRVNSVIPFAVTGVDFTGHFYVKNEEGTASKYYILIFTCLSTRAVHMEVINSMATESFVLAMIRFCNRFGLPRIIYSDNAKSFISGGNILSEIFMSDLFKSKFEPYKIEFRLNPVYSPWYGATWERLIKTIKSCINKTIGKQKLTYFNFITLISDIQATMNNRPLTYSTNIDNSIDVVTPNHFINLNNTNNTMILTSNDEFPDLDEEDDPQYDPYQKLMTSLDIRQKLINKYQRVFLQNYLLSLKRKIPDGKDYSDLEELKPGRVLLLQNDKNKPHLKMVRIISHVPSSDGVLRSVRIKTSDGSQTEVAIANLIPLELGDVKYDVDLKVDSGNSDQNEVPSQDVVSQDTMSSDVVILTESPTKSFRDRHQRDAARKCNIANQQIYEGIE